MPVHEVETGTGGSMPLQGSLGSRPVSPEAKASEKKGLSMDYIKRYLLKDLQVQATDTVSTIEVRIRERGEHTTCPRDGRPGAAYVDSIAEQYTGEANMMLSYSWSYFVMDIVSSLVMYCERNKLDLKSTWVWICCLCVNQHRVQEQLEHNTVVGVDAFMRVFEGRVRSTKRIVGLLAPWRDPQYVKRVWCLFEAWKASQTKGIELDFLLPQHEDGLDVGATSTSNSPRPACRRTRIASCR